MASSVPSSGQSQANNKPSDTGHKQGQRKHVFSKTIKFEGQCAGLKDNIYDCSDSRQETDLFVKTTKAIAEYSVVIYQPGGTDVRLSIEGGIARDVTMDKPKYPDANDQGVIDKSDEEMWRLSMRTYFDRIDRLKNNLESLYSLIWNQCTDVLKNKLEALSTHKQLSMKADGLGLLAAIKSIVYISNSDTTYLLHTLHEAKHNFYNCHQGKATLQEYLLHFQALIDAIESNTTMVSSVTTRQSTKHMLPRTTLTTPPFSPRYRRMQHKTSIWQ